MTKLHSCATAQGLPPITRKSLCESMEYFQICIGGWPKAGAVRARSELLLTQFVQWANLLEEPPRVGKEFVETLHFTGNCVLQPLYASRSLPEASLWRNQIRRWSIRSLYYVMVVVGVVEIILFWMFWYFYTNFPKIINYSKRDEEQLTTPVISSTFAYYERSDIASRSRFIGCVLHLSGSGMLMARYMESTTGCPNHVNWALNSYAARVRKEGGKHGA